MAGDNRTGRRQNDRNGRYETPERVRNAAGAMNQDTSSGLYRGYVPQNTGGYNPNAAGNPNPQAPDTLDMFPRGMREPAGCSTLHP